MAGIPDSPGAKWIGFLAGVASLAGLVVPALSGFVSASFVSIAVALGIAGAVGRLYTKRNVTNISLGKWSLKIALLLASFAIWIALTVLGNPELIKGFVSLNKFHRVIVEFFGIYSLISCIIVAVLAYLVVDVFYSLVKGVFV
ncbi:MAG: hypothetical protein AAF718_03590 [Pseudomonadota bacterium]